MSGFSDAIQGLADILGTAITGIKTHNHPVDSVNHFPTAVLLPESVDPNVALGGNSFTGQIRVIMLVASGDSAEGFRQLYDFIDPTTGSYSIIKAVRDSPTLGGTGADWARVVNIENIGRRQLPGGGNYFGFDAIIQFQKGVA